jgi:hypothetical protein
MERTKRTSGVHAPADFSVEFALEDQIELGDGELWHLRIVAVVAYAVTPFCIRTIDYLCLMRSRNIVPYCLILSEEFGEVWPSVSSVYID